MKRLLVVILLTWANLNSIAQTKNHLANTAWQDAVLMDQMVDVVFQYETDTVTMYSASDEELLETMTYTIEKDLLTWKKVSGNSPCDTQTVGTYQIKIKNDEMVITLVKDDCQARSGALPSKPFKKIAYTGK